MEAWLILHCLDISRVEVFGLIFKFKFSKFLLCKFGNRRKRTNESKFQSENQESKITIDYDMYCPSVSTASNIF